jgi:hypothetical protein
MFPKKIILGASNGVRLIYARARAIDMPITPGAQLEGADRIDIIPLLISARFLLDTLQVKAEDESITSFGHLWRQNAT